MGKVLEFNKNGKSIKEMANESRERGNLTDALSYYFSCLTITKDYSFYGEIASVYSEMECYDLSNRYWFYYLTYCKKDEKFSAYEEIAINYYYIDNLWATGYYLHKIIEEGGEVQREQFYEDFLSSFEDTLKTAKEYKLVYPFDKVDYSTHVKNAKKKMAGLEIDKAIKILSDVPMQSKDYFEALQEKAVCYFLSGKFDNGIACCKEIIENHKENTATFGTLSNIYFAKKDNDKSNYYYKKALELYTDNGDDNYSLITCALEQKDHAKAVELLEKMLKEKPFERHFKLIYAQALFNVGEYEKAQKEFSEVYRISPFDTVAKYYAKLSLYALDNRINVDDYLPLEYFPEVPKKEEKRRKNLIKKVFELPLNKLKTEIKKEDVFDTLLWGVLNDNPLVAKKSIAIISNSNRWQELAPLLLNEEINTDIKSNIIAFLILNNYKKEIFFTFGTALLSFKPVKADFDSSKYKDLFYSAYALCISRIVFFEYGNVKKIAHSAEYVCSKLKDDIIEGVTQEELAFLFLNYSGIKTEKVADYSKIFRINLDILDKITAVLEKNNDKNN